MAIRLPGAPRAERSRPNVVGPGHVRKVGLIGTAPSIAYAPWDDPDWEFWANASAVNMAPAGRLDALIDTHPHHCYSEGKKNGFADYYDFLKRTRIPVWMQDVDPAIPSSMKFPKEQIKQQYPFEFGSMTAEYIGLLLLQGVTHIGLWGCEYWDIEYFDQRPMTVFWLGLAIGKGVQVVLPPGSTLLKNAQLSVDWEKKRLTAELCGDYSWETHSTPEKYAALKAKYKNVKQHQFAKDKLVLVNDPEAARAARDLRLSLLPPAAQAAAAAFGEEDKMPIELIEQEHREAIAEELGQIQRLAAMTEGERARLVRSAVRLQLAQGLPLPDGAGAEGAESDRSQRSPVAGDGGAGAPSERDGLVQPCGDPVHGEAVDGRPVLVGGLEASGELVADPCGAA
jgi:hypothetical protein